MARKDMNTLDGTIFAKPTRFSRAKKMFKNISKSGALFSLFAASAVIFYLILGIAPNLSYSSIESDLFNSNTIASTSNATLKEATDFNAKKEPVVEEKIEETTEEPKTMAKVDLPKKTDLETPKDSYAGQPVYTATPARSNSYSYTPPANYINLAGRILPIYQNCAFQLGAYDAYVANCAGGYGGRYANFYYAHNSYGVFDILFSLGVGQTFTIVKNGVPHTYVIAEKQIQNLAELNANSSLRDRMFRANYTHSVSMQTCVGDGSTQRLYVFADEI